MIDAPSGMQAREPPACSRQATPPLRTSSKIALSGFDLLMKHTPFDVKHSKRQRREKGNEG
jgi:hypothetical protein